MSLSRRAILIRAGAIAGVGAVTFVALLFRAAETVQVGDGAEYALAAATGALAHPPGYPVYTTLIDALVGDASANPYGTVAVFSAACQAAATAALAALCLVLSGRLAVALSLAIAWAAFEGTVRTGTDAEVFALHHLISLAVAATALGLLRGVSRPRLACSALGLLCGLGGAHQTSIIFWAPLVTGSIAAVECKRRGRRGVLVASLLAGAAIGLTPYALLPLRFANAPALAFGEVATFAEVVSHVLREAYGVTSVYAGGSGQTFILHFIGRTVPVLPLFWAALPLALLRWRRAHDLGAALLALTVVAHLLFVALLRFPDDSYDHVAIRFYPATLLAGCLAIAAGLRGLVEQRRTQVVFAAALLLPALIGLPEALQRGDARSDRRGEVYLREAFQTIPEGAVWLTSTDMATFGASYWQAALGRRPDITIIAERRLPLESYRKLVGRRAAWARDADGSVPRSAGAIARRALEAGLPVVSGPLPPPPDLVTQPRGVFVQWYDAQHAPPVEETARHLLSFCSRWPAELRLLAPARADAGWIWVGGFTAPLASVMTRVARQAQVPVLAAAAAALRAGDDEAARRICGRALAEVGSAGPRTE